MVVELWTAWFSICWRTNFFALAMVMDYQAFWIIICSIEKIVKECSPKDIYIYIWSSTGGVGPSPHHIHSKLTTIVVVVVIFTAWDTSLGLAIYSELPSTTTNCSSCVVRVSISCFVPFDSRPWYHIWGSRAWSWKDLEQWQPSAHPQRVKYTCGELLNPSLLSAPTLIMLLLSTIHISDHL